MTDMCNRNFLVMIIALAFSLAMPVFAAPKKTPDKPLTPEQYYTQVRLKSAKAYNESLELQKQGKLVEAAHALKKSIEIRDYFIDTDKELPHMRLKLGELWIAAGHSDSALVVLGQSLAGFARWYGPGSEQSVKALALMGDVYTKNTDHSQAVKNYMQSYLISQRFKGKNSPETMKLRLQLAAAHTGAKELEQSASLYKEALELQQKNEKLLDKEQLLSTLTDYAAVLQELKKDEEAKAILDRADEVRSGNGGAIE